MAGNIVKWWKHKILGGYKQFTVLQECATDSEELIYPVRAPSACSAPPDLLLTSDREQMMKVKCSSKHQQSAAMAAHHQSQSQQGHHNHGHKMQGSGAATTAGGQQQQQQHPKDSTSASFRKCPGQRTATVKSDPDRVRLEEFTCDVSLEGGKKPQPLQFSFTLYDLDGHGKITKDDIAGIVSTIYESIGKSVVVPHYGSKTINVRLTVSPDGKSKTNPAVVKKAAITPRRRYRPRKLISDDDGSDTSENCPRVMRTRAHTVVANTTVSNATKQHKEAGSGKAGEDVIDAALASKAVDNAQEMTIHNNLNSKGKSLNAKNDHIYESINNLKCCNIQSAQVSKTNNLSSVPLNNSTASTTLICRDCSLQGCPIDETLPLGTVVIPSASTAMAAGSRVKRKVVRKSRSSRKASKITEEYHSRPRARSLSVGNENCYENMIGNPQDECWKSSLCRRELIEIIRDSMVKNSMCFQPNRKPMDNSPRHRHRSHTISARIGGGNGAAGDHCVGGGEAFLAAAVQQQALMPTGHETNLCGYDSYLHQTICAAASVKHAALHLNGGVTMANGGVFTALPLTTSTPNRLLAHHNHHAKAKRKEQRLALASRAQTQHQLVQPVKLSTALLNQHYPNLSAEQKLTRSINHVEKWLDNRSPKLVNKLKLMDDMMERNHRVNGSKLKRSKSKEDIATKSSKLDNVLTADLLLENLKITEDIAEFSVVTPKKVFNKECLISSATKKNIRTFHTTKTISTTTEQQQNQSAASNNLIQLQYASIPVNAEPSECENLIRMSDAEEETVIGGPQQPQSTASTPTHQHHHSTSHSAPAAPSNSGLLGEHSGSSASAASTTAVHRYVHEHIHHHYHHFENDPDES
ncbi:protein naked cuticle homolog [Uranotaenia lowii]|uniref:protein naked cuticle homolog n=1 Tax=Uranotaenia lowii TaxID=190385 RepID=UPI00247A42A2|nr:protein naked cuticle homolog [Uranotaenia lowii]XP_055591955.1 protein naked cuticle homolog [Uranotaenia lowii]XP_055591956.1 protein naked cuticle homolog [Uranotaenia lowii]XP_055591957.1 protein naked cuticle homolog [Uranotaenia lowii]